MVGAVPVGCSVVVGSSDGCRNGVESSAVCWWVVGGSADRLRIVGGTSDDCGVGFGSSVVNWLFVGRYSTGRWR